MAKIPLTEDGRSIKPNVIHPLLEMFSDPERQFDPILPVRSTTG